MLLKDTKADLLKNTWIEKRFLYTGFKLAELANLFKAFFFLTSTNRDNIRGLFTK